MEFGFSKRNLQKFEVEKGFYSKKNGIMIPSWKKMEFGFFRSGICKNLKWKITAPKAVTVKFFLAQKCNVPVERRMFPGTLAFALTAHKAQGSTYNYMIADFQKPPGYKTTPQGLGYTMLSRATCSKNIKLLNFTINNITVNKSALSEIERMRSESLFKCDELQTNRMSVRHLNIRSLKAHLIDLQKELTAQHCDIICLSETHVDNELNQYTLNGYTTFSKATQHGLAIYVNDSANCQQIDIPMPCKIQIVGISLQISRLQHHPIIVTYKPPNMPVTFFLNHLDTIVQQILHSFHSIIILGDFNMMPENAQFIDFLQRHSLKQLVQSTTHTLGSTLDFIITSVPVEKITNKPVPFSDHNLLCATFVNVI